MTAKRRAQKLLAMSPANWPAAIDKFIADSNHAIAVADSVIDIQVTTKELVGVLIERLHAKHGLGV